MKRLIFGGALLLLLPIVCFAETGVESNAYSDVYIDQSDNSADNYDYGNTDYSFPYLGRMDSSSTHAIQPVYNLEKLGDMRGLPHDLGKMGWRVLDFPERLVREGIPKKVLEKSRASWLKDRHTDTGWPVIEKAGDRVYPVNFYPKDGSAVAVRHSKSYAHEEKYLPVEAKYESIYHGAQSGGKYFVVLYNIHYISKAKNFSLGTTIVGNAALQENGERLLSTGGGSGWGKAQSWVWERGGYWTIFFDKRPVPDLPEKKAKSRKVAASNKGKATPPKPVKTKPQAPPKKQVVKKTPSVLFDHDSSALRNDQLVVIDEITAEVVKHIPGLLAEGRIIRIIGGASREGDHGYNLPLSDRRAKAVHIAIAQRLKHQHNIGADVIAKVLQHAAIGENYPDFDKRYPDSRNRRVFLEISNRITE